MKRKLFALLICVQIILSAFVPIFTTVAANEGDATGGASQGTTPDTTPTSSVTSIFPDSKLTWVSYRDYLLQQATNAWNTPEMYVGYEIQFLSCWDSTPIRSGFDQDSVENYALFAFGEEQLLADNVIIVDQVKLVIDGYHYDEETKDLWYKVKAAEGSELPEILVECPYILYVNCDDLEGGGFDYNPPTFNIGPLKGIFRNSGTVNFKKQNVAASAMTQVAISDLPEIFDITPAFDYGTSYGDIVWGDYDVGTIASEYTDYHYVSVDDIIIIPADATIAYDTLIKTEDTYDYYACLGEIPNGVLELLSDKHKDALNIHIAKLEAEESIVRETTVMLNGVEVPIRAVGRIPDGTTLYATPVSNDTVISEGFDIKDPADIITALDIKILYDADGTEWQPKENRRVGVSIGMPALGYADGTVFRVQHKHGESFEDYSIAVVMGGFLTVYSAGFSTYVVSAVLQTNTNGATELNQNRVVELEVGQEVVYYCNSNSSGTWDVYDPNGAIYYTVHTQSSPGGNALRIPWIKIVALKVDTQVTITYRTTSTNTNNHESYDINVVTPKAKANEYNGRKLYIIDEVNNSGNITAALVDTNGNALSLEGAAFSWSRDDGYFINPDTYSDNYRSINIALDHGGLVEARKTADRFVPTTYTVTAILADGTSIPASYTVYYQSEIINAGFEFPAKSTSSNYFFFANGWPELYWKTTAPGTGGNITKDVEYGYYKQSNAQTTWGPTQSADDADGGECFAEINAEEFGALYQDIITVPGEDIEWNFSHAPRQNPSARETLTNSMFIIIGATESAQKLTQAQIEALGTQAKTEAGTGNTAFLNGQIPEAVEYTNTTTNETATYYVWYHDAGTVTNGNNRPEYNKEHNYGWTALEGSYSVPEGQYRTRLFFVTEKRAESSHQNYGNLIDAAKGGQYKKYLIEYYVGTVTHNEDHSHSLVTEHMTAYDEEGLALVYASVPLTSLNYFVNTRHAYLQQILVNGNNYPYNISYKGDQGSLYIQKYPSSEDFKEEVEDNPKYAEYDVVMRIYLREVVISVETEIEFPSTLTAEQKLSIIQNQVAADGGYKSYVTVMSTDPGYSYNEQEYVLITHRDPVGEYTGFFSVHEMPEINHTYRAEQTDISDIPGLYVLRTEITVKIYERGLLRDTIVGSNGAVEFELAPSDGDYNVYADVIIKNVYAEKMTTIYYKGVGNGKVAFIGSGSDFQDTPTEELAYYSGQAKGAAIHPGAGAIFAGWYTDEACTTLVTEKDGVWDADDNFKPNANILNADSVTFYAKFQSGTIEIRRTNANPGQVFVYYVESADGKVKLYVPLVCDENGSGVAYVLEVPLQEYTVTELEDWSWRNPGKEIEQTGNDANQNIVFTFDTPVSKDKWLNGYDDPKENVYN